MLEMIILVRSNVLSRFCAAGFTLKAFPLLINDFRFHIRRKMFYFGRVKRYEAPSFSIGQDSNKDNWL